MAFDEETIIAKVNSQDIDILSCPKLVSKSRKLYKAHFHFDESWEGYIVKAVFKTRAAEKEQALVNNECYVPWECLEEHNVHLSIGIYGVQDETTRPTVWGKELFIYPGAGTAEEAKEPTPDVYQQFVNQIEAGKMQGPPGPAGPTGPTGPAGPAGPQGETGKSGIYIGSDTPPEDASVWINPGGTPTGAEVWEFELEDGTVITRTVVVVGKS